MERPKIFITGGTGYIGSRLISILIQKGYAVKALVRKGSENKLPKGCKVVFGNALDASTFSSSIQDCSVFIHMVGVAHPSPKMKDQFRAIDLRSIQASVEAIKEHPVDHFIYISVAQFPTKIMHDFQEVRAQGEKLLLSVNKSNSILRPWYVLGPAHWWPVLLYPLYLAAELFPTIREKTRKLYWVTITQMLRTLLYALEHPPTGTKYYEVSDIRKK